MPPADVDAGIHYGNLMKNQRPGIQEAEDDLLRQLRQTDDPDIRPVVVYVVNDGVHVHLPDRKLVAAGLRGLEQLNEGVLRKGVPLRGYGKVRSRSGVPCLAIAALNPLFLL